MLLRVTSIDSVYLARFKPQASLEETQNVYGAPAAKPMDVRWINEALQQQKPEWPACVRCLCVLKMVVFEVSVRRTAVSELLIDVVYSSWSCHGWLYLYLYGTPRREAEGTRDGAAEALNLNPYSTTVYIFGGGKCEWGEGTRPWRRAGAPRGCLNWRSLTSNIYYVVLY